MKGDDRRGRRGSPDARIEAAVARIEQVARELSAEATGRAADYMEEVADRFSDAPPRRREKSSSWPWSGRPRTARLHRDREHGKLLGVCAGIANYSGLETWVVRLIALTGLVFLTSVTLVGYFVAALLMDPGPTGRRQRRERRRGPAGATPTRHRKWHRRHSEDGGSEAHEWIPRQRLRDVRAGFDQIELKLRRMEAHVTSEHYELHRELAELENSGGGSSTSRSG